VVNYLNKKTTIVAFILATVTVFASFMPVFASHIVNINGALSSTPSWWDLQSWNSDATDTYSISSGVGTFYRYDYQNPKEWGNREAAQAYDLWNLYGDPYGDAWDDGVIPLNETSQSLSWRAKYSDAAAYWFGGSDVYINMWIMFSEPVGKENREYGEIIIYLKTYGFVGIGPDLRNDGEGTEWYFYGVSASAIGTSWTTGSINYNTIINNFCNSHEIDATEKAKGATIGMCIGVEAKDAKMKGYFDYVFYYSD
jgi:hypothetical protein